MTPHQSFDNFEYTHNVFQHNSLITYFVLQHHTKTKLTTKKVQHYNVLKNLPVNILLASESEDIFPCLTYS